LGKLTSKLTKWGINEKQKYHTLGTVPIANRKVVERTKTDTQNTHVHDLSLS